MILAGRVEGNVEAKTRLEIMNTGVMLGDVSSSVLIIEEGGVLDGTSKMGKANEKSEIGKLAEIKKSKA